MKIGFVGLPNAGKSTLFNALTFGHAPVAPYPFTTIDPAIGVVRVPDARLEALTSVAGSVKVTPTTLEIVDIAGLIKGAHRGEGLGNQFLSHIRDVDAVVYVLRAFTNPDVALVHDVVDPKVDVEVLRTELALSDLGTVEKRLREVERLRKTGEPRYAREGQFLEELKEHLNRGSLHLRECSDEEAGWMAEYRLLLHKPAIYVVNIDEGALGGGAPDLGLEGRVLLCSAKLEAELAELGPEERGTFIQEYGLKESALESLIRTMYALLSVVTFYTFNEKELRAWTIRRGAKVPQAAGKIHSDMERGFIKAEIIQAQALANAGSLAAAREAGLVRVGGKEDIVQDGDVLYIHFSR